LSSIAGLSNLEFLEVKLKFEITPPTRDAVDAWIKEIGLDPALYGTHSMRRTKATLIDRRTKNLRAVQLLLGHNKIENTARYQGYRSRRRAFQTRYSQRLWRHLVFKGDQREKAQKIGL
jgi:integrase